MPGEEASVYPDAQRGRRPKAKEPSPSNQARDDREVAVALILPAKAFDEAVDVAA